MSPKLETRLDEKNGCERFCSRPNCALSEQACKKVFWGVAGITLSISVVFAAMGYWLTLPFAGLEIGVLAWSFEQIHKHRDDYETLRVEGEELYVEARHGEQLQNLRFNRQWSRLVSGKDAVSGHYSLMIRSHGRDTPLGRYLDDDRRKQLGAVLQKWLGQSANTA